MKNFWKLDFSLFFPLLLLFFLLLASCGTQQKTPLSNEEFWEGTGALEFSFVDENPPETVYENTPFTIVLDVQNTGAHTLSGFMTLSIEDDYLCLVDENNECSTFSTVDAQTLSKDSVLIWNPYKSKWFTLEGKSIFNYEGGTDTIPYKAKAKSAGALSESHEVAVIATSCYEYTTTWNQEVCIDTDVNKMNVFPGACSSEDISLSSQGAPLAITSIEPSMIPTGDGYIRPLFKIYVANVGNGQLINKDKIEQACTATGLAARDYNMLFLKSFVLSTEDILYDFNGYDIVTGKELNPGTDGDLISCSPNPLILKEDGNDYITCILNEGITLDQFSLNQASYTTQISLQFEYGYMLSLSQPITIEKILTY